MDQARPKPPTETGDPGKPMITPLGRWAAGRLPEGLPGLADPGLPAAEMIAGAARFSDLEQRDHVAWGWLAERQPAEAAREILAAAEQMSPLLRSVAVGVAQRLGPDMLTAWQDMAAAPRVGPHARAVLAAWDQGPEPSEADWRWLAVEAAAAALEDKGADEALTRVWESMPGTDLDTRLAKVRAAGHPDAARLAQALAEFAASGAPSSIDQVAELKVSLAGSRPLAWRRVRLPLTATLGDLHDAIQVLFGWDGDHLHVFQAGKKHYSDPFVNLDQTGDELAVRVRDVLAPGGKISYTYDLGACWEHQITLEKLMPRDPGQDYPVCVRYKGDSPVEYWSDDDPEEPEPFNLAEVNRRLAALGEGGEWRGASGQEPRRAVPRLPHRARRGPETRPGRLRPQPAVRTAGGTVRAGKRLRRDTGRGRSHRRHRPVRASAHPAERQDRTGPVPRQPARSHRGGPGDAARLARPGGGDLRDPPQGQGLARPAEPAR